MISLILLFFTLAFLEVMLSGDNAVVLASIAKRLDNEEEQDKALNIGMIGSYILRVIVIVSGVWLFNLPVWGPIVKYLGAGYLIYLFIDFLMNKQEKEDNSKSSFWPVVTTIMLSDLAFSLDSATTALALTNNTYIILGACLTGVIALRFLAGLFVKLIDQFSRLETAGYIAVLLVGLQLIIKTYLDLEIPELYDVAAIVAIFSWGFSKRTELETI